MSIKEFILNCNFDNPVVLSFGVSDSLIDFVETTKYSDEIECADLICVHSSKFDQVADYDLVKTTQYVWLVYQYVGEDHPISEVLDKLPGKWAVRVHQENDFLLENINYRESLISNTGAWNVKNMNEHAFDSNLAEATVNFMKMSGIKSCVDFGCGPGNYVAYFKNLGIDVEGYDGNPYTKELTSGLCDIIDLSEKFDLGKKFDLVMSLEVGEHIPNQFEDAFIDNLTSHSNKWILLSWSIPGQDGYGHVNNQPNEHIREQMIKRGFVPHIYMENIFRLAASMTWFKSTIMLFSKDGVSES